MKSFIEFSILEYKRFEYFGKDYQVSFFSSLFSYHLFIWLVRLKRNELQKKDKKYFQTQLLFSNLELFCKERNVLHPKHYNSCPTPCQGVYQDLRRSFFLALGSPYFQECGDCSFCQRPLGRLFLVFIFFCVYFILYLCFFMLLFVCFFKFIYYSISTSSQNKHKVHRM